MSKQWNGPMPSAELDARVYAAFRKNARSRFWIPTVAAAAGIVVVAGLWMRRPIELEMDSAVFVSPTGVTAETQLNATGFVPIPNGRIIVMDKAGN